MKRKDTIKARIRYCEELANSFSHICYDVSPLLQLQDQNKSLPEARVFLKKEKLCTFYFMDSQMIRRPTTKHPNATANHQAKHNTFTSEHKPDQRSPIKFRDNTNQQLLRNGGGLELSMENSSASYSRIRHQLPILQKKWYIKHKVQISSK